MLQTVLQTSLLFLHTADADKNYNGELELKSSSPYPSAFLKVSIICILISLLGLIGNGIVFGLLCCTIKKTKFTIYAANMALGDFLSMLHAFISFLAFFTPPFMTTNTQQIITIIYFFGHETGSYFLTAMTAERCLTVFAPVWYQSHRRKCPTAFICALLWILSVTLKLLDHFLCSHRYIFILKIGVFPCIVATIFHRMVFFIILFPSMLFSTLALFIRIKRKPQQNLPARLDISILATVVLHLILHPTAEIIVLILFSTPFAHLNFFYVTLIFHCMGSSINPFIYLLVGSWKRKKDQEPFCMFLERALSHGGKGRRRTQPDQEQA